VPQTTSNSGVNGDRKKAKMFNNLIPTSKKPTKLSNKGVIKPASTKTIENGESNSIYRGPVIKKKMLD
jgi:hypothetical protein